MACAEPEQPTSTPTLPPATATPTPSPTPTPEFPTATPTPSPTPTLIPTPSPTPDALAAIQDACESLEGHVPYDVTYTISYPPSIRILSEIRVNERGEFHAFATLLSGYEGEHTDWLFVDDSFYEREWSEGEPGLWSRSSSRSLHGVSAPAFCAHSYESGEGELDALSAELADLGGAAFYTDLGNTTLNGIDVRHLRFEATWDDPNPGGRRRTLADEYWITPDGQIKQHRLTNSVGSVATEWLGIISGVGEPNVIEAPVLPTPAP